MNSRQRRRERRSLIAEVDKALQEIWDKLPAPEWFRVIEPISVEGKTIEPGFYVLDASGNYRRQDAEALK